MDLKAFKEHMDALVTNFKPVVAAMNGLPETIMANTLKKTVYVAAPSYAWARNALAGIADGHSVQFLTPPFHHLRGTKGAIVVIIDRERIPWHQSTERAFLEMVKTCQAELHWMYEGAHVPSGLLNALGKEMDFSGDARIRKIMDELGGVISSGPTLYGDLYEADDFG